MYRIKEIKIANNVMKNVRDVMSLMHGSGEMKAPGSPIASSLLRAPKRGPHEPTGTWR